MTQNTKKTHQLCFHFPPEPLKNQPAATQPAASQPASQPASQQPASSQPAGRRLNIHSPSAFGILGYGTTNVGHGTTYADAGVGIGLNFLKRGIQTFYKKGHELAGNAIN